MELQGKIIHFLGDSITEGVGVSHPSKIYHALIKEQYGLKAANNYGISGTCLADRRTPLEIELFNRHFVSRVDEMDPEADVIVVFGGTNDFGHGEAVMGTPNDRTPDTFYGACHHLYRTLIDKYPTVPIVVMTPLHRWYEDVPQVRVSADGMVKEAVTLRTYVEIIREVAGYYGLPICDLYANAGFHPEIESQRNALCPDGLHPNDAGHVIIASRLAGVLKAL